MCFGVLWEFSYSIDYTAFSASYWVKFNSLANTYNGTVAQQISGSPNVAGWAVSYHTGAVWLFGRSGSTNFVDQSTEFVPSLETWYYFTTTWDSAGDGKMRFYLNGSLYKTSDGSSATPMTGLPKVLMGALQWADGNQNSIAANQGLNGVLDDVRIYNRALSATEVTALYEVYH